MLAHRLAGPLPVVKKVRIGNLAFQLLEALPFTRDEGLEVHKQKRRLHAEAQSPFVRQNQLSLFRDAGAGRLRAAIAARKFLDAAGGIDKLLFAGEKRMAGRADADLDVPAGGTGMVDRTAGAANLRLVVLRMNVRFHRKRAVKVAAKTGYRK